jgi:RNA polymerase sigma-70 factor (ECF subfamily)
MDHMPQRLAVLHHVMARSSEASWIWEYTTGIGAMAPFGTAMAVWPIRRRQQTRIYMGWCCCMAPGCTVSSFQKIGHVADAQDLVQQTFLEAHRALASFKGDSELSTWLYGIAKNLVRNYLTRSPHRRFDFCSDELLMEEQDGGPSPMDVLDQGQQLRALTLAMSEIPEHMRQLVWMVVVDELSYEEAAAALNIPKGTVRSRLSRARSALRARMPKPVAVA